MTGARETATQLDRSIDRLLRGEDGPRSLLEGELTTTARLLRDVLPRFHPRFGFEELLAARLAAARPKRAAISVEPTPFRPGMSPADTHEPVPEDAAAEAAAEAADHRRRGLVAGGAIASGVSLALPLAGAAIVVWRRSRSSGGLL